MADSGSDEDEEELSEEQQKALEALCEEFEDLLRDLRLHQKTWCERNPSYKYQGVPPLGLADKLVDLAKRAAAMAGRCKLTLA